MSSCICKRCRCSHKLYINVLRTFIQFVSASAPFTHAWTPEKKRLILYYMVIMPCNIKKYTAVWPSRMTLTYWTLSILFLWCSWQVFSYLALLYKKKIVSLRSPLSYICHLRRFRSSCLDRLLVFFCPRLFNHLAFVSFDL
jgi:hypothetical protein